MRVFMFFLPFSLYVKIPPIDSGNVLKDCEANSEEDTPSRSLFQGDIAIEVDQKRDTNQGHKKVAFAFVKSKTRIWLGGHIPYTFKPFVFCKAGSVITELAFSEKSMNMIKEGLQHISEMVPCLTFRESNKKDEHKLIFTTQSDANHKDQEGACFAYIGKLTTPLVDKDGECGQIINLGLAECFNLGTVIHEVLHSLGASHEHNNPDRNSHINIIWENIDPDYLNQFDITDPTEFSNYHTDYDVDSIMHYELNRASKSTDLPTMELKDKTKIITPLSGRTNMSITDIIELGRVYEDHTSRSCFTQDNLYKYTQDNLYKYSQLPAANETCKDAYNRVESNCHTVHLYCPGNRRCPVDGVYHRCKQESYEYILTCSIFYPNPSQQQCMDYIKYFTYMGPKWRCWQCCKYYDCGGDMPRCASSSTGNCFQEQAAYVGYKIGRTYYYDNVQECQRKCQRKSYCQHFNFMQERGEVDGKCELQTRKGNFAGKPGKTGYKTGPRVCP